MITDIRLQNFRSYEDDAFEFDPGVNIIVGPNASGKTNLLEAILVLSVGKSYRAKDVGLMAYGVPWSRLEANIDGQHRVVKLKSDGDVAKKEYEFDDVAFKRLLLSKAKPVVLFEPNHLMLFAGSPEARREYMDVLLEQTLPEFQTIQRHYKRALAQRNALLKRGYQAVDQIFVWNVRLSQLGEELVRLRLEIINKISERISVVYSGLANRPTDIKLLYSSRCDVSQYGSDLLRKLEQHQTLDMERGFTGFGPHRDDLLAELNGRGLQGVASRGETRTFLLALKIIELDLIESARGQKPFLLLDDVFSELDGSRRRALTEVLTDHQAFITTTDADMVIAHFSGSRVIPLG